MSSSKLGKAARRIDGPSKVRGTLQYPIDIYSPEVLCCRCVFAPHPHALIHAIDTTEALAVPGVIRVITAADIPGRNVCTYNGDRPVICADKTRYEGDVVAVVVAETEDSAEEGVRRVKIDFTPLPIVSDPTLAILPESPKVHAAGNIMHEVHYKNGDPQGIFSRSDVVTIEKTFSTPATDHVFLETEAAVAYPDDGGIRMITGGQDAYYHKRQIENALALPPEKVRVIETQTGGAFGGKADVTVQIFVALAVYHTGRPCRMAWSRHEHFISGVKRHPSLIRLRGAASPDGKLLALDAYAVLDTGAYAVKGDVVLDIAVEYLTGPYSIPNVNIDAWLAYTNNYVCGAFRGFGGNKACFAIEGLISALADELGIDQIAFRRMNLVKQGEISGIGHPLLAPVHFDYALEAVDRHALWKDRTKIKKSEGSLRRGVGLALGVKGYGYGSGNVPDYGKARITLGLDGRLLLSVGAVEYGQGSITSLAQIAAETLHCSLEQVDVSAADTLDDTDSGTTASSRTTYAVGRAVVEAGQELVRKIQAVAGGLFKIPPETIQLVDGVILNPAGGEPLSFSDLAQYAEEPLSATAVSRVAYSEASMDGAAVAHPHVLYASNTQVAQVAVDIETGEVHLEKMAVFPEVGRVIYRDGLEGQFEGGIGLGLGYALLEEVIVEEGYMRNADLTTYPVPTVLDMPQIEVHPIEIPEPTGPYGAKGVAELAQLPTAPAITAAIQDAIGIRFTTLPVTPEMILEALEKNAQ